MFGMTGMTPTEALRLLAEKGQCVQAPVSTGGSTVPTNRKWEWTAEGSAVQCLTFDEGKVTKTTETDGDYHICLGPMFERGSHSLKVHVLASCTMHSVLTSVTGRACKQHANGYM